MTAHPKSETSKFRGLAAPFCTGIGIDVGAGGDPIIPTAICVDLPQPYCPMLGEAPVHVSIDCRKLWTIFANESLDYIYTSHLLEDFNWIDCQNILDSWVHLIKPGGYLVILVPEYHLWRRALDRGQPPNYNHRHEFRIGELSDHFREFNMTHSTQFEVIGESIPDPEDYSILFVAKRKSDV